MIQCLLQIGLVLLFLFTGWIFPAQALDGLQDAQILEVIRSHPQEILDSLIKFQQKESQSQSEKQSQRLQEVTHDRKQFISNSPHKGRLFSQKTIVEFSDFQCPFCKLFDSQEILGDRLYQTIARSLNLDIDRFNHDRESQAATEAIEADIRQAEQLGVMGTPFFLVLGPKEARISDLNNLELTIGQV